MTFTIPLTRRNLLAVMIGGTSLAVAPSARAQTSAIKVFKDPSCGCCGGWVDHLRQAGYDVAVEEPADLDAVKKRLAVPAELWACHTATAAGYTIEGHVPAHALARLFAERPRFAGLAVPGMPVGSPGMEADRRDVYEVIGFEGRRRISFGRYRGDTPI
jgi:hypothetical protein